MSYSLLNDHTLSRLAGDGEIAALFSAKADIEAMLAFEVALARVEAGHGIVPQGAAPGIAEGIAAFAPDYQALAETTARDGVAVPGLVAQLRDQLDGDASKYLHFGATSQDATDTSLMLRLKSAGEILCARLTGIEAGLAGLATEHGGRKMMGRTRMQAALGITLGDRIAAWHAPLADARRRLESLAVSRTPLQFGGATGTLEKLGDMGAPVRASLAKELGLQDPERCWHADRAVIADWGHVLSLVSGALGKMGQDIALMVQNGIDEIALAGGGTSSAMPHKSNPVGAEVLVSLARYNSTQQTALHQSLVHEQERSGAAWTLEWMVLPQICVTTGAATLTAKQLIGQLRLPA